jgi:hypothetical protein
MKSQRLFLIHSNLISLLVLLIQDILFSGILELRLPRCKKVLWRRMDIHIQFTHWLLLVHRMHIILYLSRMIVNFVCGILENLVIQKLVSIYLIKDKVVKEIKRCCTLTQWNSQRKKQINSSLVPKTTTFIKQMLINLSIT